VKQILPFLLLGCLFGQGCHVQKGSIAVREYNDEIIAQSKHTSYRLVKMKKAQPRQYYAIPKDNSGNYRMYIIFPSDKVFWLIYLNEKLVRATVDVNTGVKNEWNNGIYFFKDGDMIYKEEQRENLISPDEIKKIADEYFRKAKTL